MNTQKKKNLTAGRILYWTASITILVIILALVLNHLKIISLQAIFYNLPSSSGISQLTGNLPGGTGKIIAKAGAEEIYQTDLDTEIKHYPLPATETVRKNLLNKIIKDSIILQSVKSTGYTKLDRTVYNSAQKDYLKRVKLVEDVKKMLENRQSAISGHIIAVWFLNGRPGNAGYEKGRQIAFNKVTALQAQVKAKTITIQQAAQSIIDDKSLAQADPSYAGNAILSFKANPNDAITHDADFNEIIWSLSPGDVSEVYAAKDKAQGFEDQTETAYMFAQITEKKVSGIKFDFEGWYKEQEKKYEIIYY